MNRKMAEMTWPQVDDYLSCHPYDASVIIPIGPVEEHGPHLPIGSDIQSAAAVADIVAQRRHWLIFPSIPLMVCGISHDVTGTYSISPTTLSMITKDLVSELAKKGFRRILFFTGHGGYSMKIIREAIKEVQVLLPKISFRADVLNFEEACPEQPQIVGVDERDIHAGGIETSRMMYLFPVSVKYFPNTDYHQKTASGAVLSKSGICGDPQKASFEKGRQIVDATVKAIIEWMEAV